MSLTVGCHLKLKNRNRACPGDVRRLSLRRQSVPDLAEYEFADGVCRMAPAGGVTKRHNLASGFSNFTCRTPHHTHMFRTRYRHGQTAAASVN